MRSILKDNHSKISVLVTGRYETDYNRTLILLAGLRSIGVRVIEYPFLKKTRETYIKLRERAQHVDFVFMPSFTHLDVRFVRRATTKPLVFDPLVSRYMTKVYDYKRVSRYSPRALKNYLKDLVSMRTADIVIADTEQHRQYFHNVIKIQEEKIKIIPVGVDTNLFFPMSKGTNTRIKVGFYGSYIPLHGIDRIIEAARLLRSYTDIHFEVVGNGFEEKKVKALVRKDPLQNLTLTDLVPYHQLNHKINTFDICLGVFGSGIKTGMVVPNKVFHYAACGKCIITKNTSAIHEVFTHQQDIMLCDGTAQGIADTIVYLKENTQIRQNIATTAHQLVVQRYNQDIIAQRLLTVASDLLQD